MAITAAQLDVKFTSSGADKVKGDLKDIGDATNSANSGFQKFQNAMLGFGTAMIPVLGAGINFSMNMEQAMADVNASLGGVDTSVLEELEQGFLDIGAASQYSAVEVAAVGDEIARAGFATDDITAMTQSVVDLSQATGADLMTSVAGITSAMQTWSPAIVDTEIALTDAARAADIFTVAANASSADVEDIIAGMRNFGPTAASIGIGFDEASAAIAYFTNYGLKAANAGVSMTRAIQNLQNPTAEAAELMNELGISVFDLEGNFVGLPTLFDQLNVAMKDMTPEARNMALTTLFGAEAIDVMTIAAMTGGDPLRMIQGEMEGTGQAAEQSAIRMDTLKAQLGELFESATNLTGQLVRGLMPGLRGLVDVGNVVINAISRLPQSFLSAVGAVGALAAAFATLKGAATGLQILGRLTGTTLPGTALLTGLATPLLAIAAAAGIAYLAIRTNFLGIGDAADRLVGRMRGLYNVFDNLLDAGLDPVNAALVALGRVFPSISDEVQWLARRWNDLVLTAQDAVRTFEFATNVFRNLMDAGINPVSAALRTLGTVFPEVSEVTTALSGAFTNLLAAWDALRVGEWSLAFSNVRMAADLAWDAIQTIASGIGGLVVDLVNWTINVGVPTVTGWIVDAASNAWGAISAAAGWAWDGLVALGAWTLNTAVPAITGWIADNAGNVWDALSTAAGWVWDGIVELGSWVLNVAVPQVVGSATAIWDAIKGWVIGETGGVLSLPNIAVTVTDWIITGGGELIAKLDEFIFGEAGDREFTIPVINVTVSRVNVLPFGDKIQEGIDTAVRVWQTAQEVHADIEEIRVRAGRARIDDSGGGGGFLDYLKGEIQTEIDHASATWDFIVDFSIVAHAEVRDEDSTYNQVVDLIGDMAGGWGMLHGGTVDWDFVLGEPEILGFGLIDAAVWVDEHIYQPIKDAVDGLKLTFDLAAITINWPDPPEVPGWLKQLFTDPAGWIKDQVGIGGSDEGTSGAGEVIGNFMSDLEFGAARATGAMLQAAAAVREAGDASEEASTQTSLLETAAQTASRGVYNFGVRFAEAMGLGMQPLMAMRSQVESLGRFLSVSLPPVKVQVTAETDMAMQGMSAVQNALAGLDGASATTYQLGDNAGAMASVAEAAGAVAGIDGMTALTHVNGDNANALGAVMGAAAAVGGIDGMTATTYINGVNNVGAAVADAWNALNSIDGATATAYVNVVSSGSGLGGRVPGFADGGFVRSPVALVGERGPELVQLPYGSYVHTADETARILAHRDDGIAPPRSSGSRDGGGDTYYVNVRIDGNVIGNDDFADAVAEHTVWKIASTKQRRDLAKGVAA